MKPLGKRLGIVLGICLILILAACISNNKEANSDQDKIKVITTIAQIGKPLSVIGGDRLEVKSLMGPSVDPHLYKGYTWRH